MNDNIIIYGSRYGSARRYAEALSHKTGIPAVDYKKAPKVSDKRVILYFGSLYAGAVLGFKETFRGFSLQDGQKLILATVGLTDPKEPETVQMIRTALQKQPTGELASQAKLFPLRGGIDYRRLSFAHRAVMALLYHSLRRTPAEKLTAGNRAILETYGKQIDFTNMSDLDPIIQEISK